MYKKKLIEVALPLEAINAASAREKSIRHGHPSTLHLWWARRPLATARAVIWASLVDDPSSRPEEFPTEEEQNKERERLFKILEDLVIWENSNNEMVLEKAKAEIMKSTDGNPPEFLDPFAGGGTLPIEAQRLGLISNGFDLNPIPVMINKASIEIPPKFYNFQPVNPMCNTDSSIIGFNGIEGLISDIEYYGEWIKNQAQERLSSLYPSMKNPDTGEDETVIAWIWARTIKCPNPACAKEVPLIRSLNISKKKNNEFHINISSNQNGVEYSIESGKAKGSTGTISRQGAICPHCGESIKFPYIRDEAQHGKMQERMVGVISEGKKRRNFFSPNGDQIKAAIVEKPKNYPDAELPYNPRNFQTPNYGMTRFSDLFTNRQLQTMTTFSSLVNEAIEQVIADGEKMGLENDGRHLKDGGIGLQAYAEAVGVYLAFAVDREANYCSSVNGWSGDFIIQVFGRQAIPMVWDFAESNPFSNSTGNWMGAIKWITLALQKMPAQGIGYAEQHAAQEKLNLSNLLISTDPPYYDNIIYGDLADYFYLWMRSTLKDIYPDLFKTMLVPKKEELVASSYRFDGNSDEAKQYFEDGMLQVCQNLKEYASADFPITIYYAFKQADVVKIENEFSVASSGWETMLTAIINSGLNIIGTWPIHTERETGLKSAMNALASSIVLVCRKRTLNSKSISRRQFIKELKKELKSSLSTLQLSNIAPVDLAQSAIGPGMAVFSKYKSILESDGKPMSVRTALAIINQEIDVFFNEQDSDLHAEDRFCVDLYTQCGFDSIKYGEADTLARAKNTSVEKLAHSGTVFAEKGVVHLIDRDELSKKVDNSSPLWTLTQQLVRAMDKNGIEGAAKFLNEVLGRHESMKSLAYRLFTIAEKKNWAQEAYVYNNLVVAWPEIQDRLTELKSNNFETQTLF